MKSKKNHTSSCRKTEKEETHSCIVNPQINFEISLTLNAGIVQFLNEEVFRGSCPVQKTEKALCSKLDNTVLQKVTCGTKQHAGEEDNNEDEDEDDGYDDMTMATPMTMMLANT